MEATQLKSSWGEREGAGSRVYSMFSADQFLDPLHHAATRLTASTKEERDKQKTQKNYFLTTEIQFTLKDQIVIRCSK